MDNNDSLHQVMSDILLIDPTTINDDTSVDTVETWDSLKHLNLVLALEEKFDVSFTEDQTIEMLSYPLIRIVLQEHGIVFS